MRKIIVFVSLMILISFIPTTIQAQDSNPPIVEYYEPFGESVNSTQEIRIEFSDSMNKTSVIEGFTLSNSTITFNESDGEMGWPKDYLFTYDLDKKYHSETVYDVRLNASIVKNESGSYLDGDGDQVAEGSPEDDFSWSFESEDTIPLEVVNKSPTGDNVEVETVIKMTFDEEPNKTSVEEAFRLECPYDTTYNVHHGNVEWEGNTFIFNPDEKLKESTKGAKYTYKVVLEDSAKDTSGNNLEEDYTWTFQTENEHTATFFGKFFPSIMIFVVILVIGILIVAGFFKASEGDL